MQVKRRLAKSVDAAVTAQPALDDLKSSEAERGARAHCAGVCIMLAGLINVSDGFVCFSCSLHSRIY